MKVLVHTRHEGQVEWHSRLQSFVRLPVVGEFIAEQTGSDWYRVGVVVHTPYTEEYDAELYALKTDERSEMGKAFP